MTITFALKNEEHKRGFFDRERIEKAVDAATRKNLSKWGAFVRKDARGSLKRRKKISKPGETPSIHYRGSTASDNGLKSIYFSYDEAKKNVVAGPIKFNRKSTPTVPELMEHGGIGPARGNMKKSGKYAKRPFMAPAAERTNSQIEKLWKNSIRG